MRKVIANVWMTLDGVVQAPSYADEDVTGGFVHGGWHTRYFDDLSMNWVIENVRGAGGYLLGRGTYEIFAAHWPNAPEEQRVLAEPLNELRLMIDLLVVGGGERLFRDDGAHRALRLADSQVTSTGAIIATYAAAGG
jgi:dihydrofolate reductase